MEADYWPPIAGVGRYILLAARKYSSPYEVSRHASEYIAQYPRWEQSTRTGCVCFHRYCAAGYSFSMVWDFSLVIIHPQT